MTIAFNEMNQIQQGALKSDFEMSIKQISDQIHRMDQKLTMKVDNMIWADFQNQQNEIRYLEILIERIK